VDRQVQEFFKDDRVNNLLQGDASTGVDLSKNIGWANQNLGDAKGGKVINAWAFLNF